MISRLRAAREMFDKPDSELELIMLGPVLPSVYERDLPHLSPAGALASNSRLGRGGIPDSPLPHPCPHVLDGGGMSLVSGASRIFTGNGLASGVDSDVGSEKRNGSVVGSPLQARGSVFSKFW